MEVNQVRFGNYTIGNSTPRQQKKEEKTEKEAQAQISSGEVKSVNREDLLNAMDMVALQNKPQVNSKELNPAELLSEERMTDIEAMMAEFESGVEKIADEIGQEFGDMSEATKNALAAEVFAQE